MRRLALCLGLLTTGVGYAVAMQGGDGRVDAGRVLLILAGAAILASTWRPLIRLRSQRDHLVDFAALAIPAYVACQVIPLPVALLDLLSHTRAELGEALAGITSAPAFAPLSISPANTWIQLSRIVACTIAFFLGRQLAAGSRASAWRPVAPLIAIGALEGAVGIAQSMTGASYATGTYLSRNHFAGLLEMVLPLALMAGVAALSGRSGDHRQEEPLSVPAAVKAGAFFTVATVIFAGIMLSVSKMGIVSMCGSLFVMGTMKLVQARAGWKQWSLVGVLGVTVIVVFVFLAPIQVIERFGGLAGDDASEGRLPIAKDALRLAAAYPLFGSGLGNFYPAILKYQTSGFGVAWVNAHNDYLQLLTELGVIGLLIPALLIGALLLRAHAAARSAAPLDARCLALGCIGAVTAILIHSVADFNMYVMANALVLAWILGVAAALPRPGPGLQRNRQAARRSAPRWPLLVIGCLGGAYAAGSLVFLQWYHNDPAAERAFCRFGICDTEAAMAALPRQDGTPADGPLTPAQLLAYLPRDSAAPDRWADVAEAMQKAGDTPAARYGFARAIALAPDSPPTLLMAADFHFNIREYAEGLRLMSRTLTLSDQFDRPVFRTLEVRRFRPDEIIPAGMLDRRSSAVYLRGLIEGGHRADAGETWRWMVQQGYADDRLAHDYVEFLVRASGGNAALAAWTLYAGPRSPGYPESNRIFNGDFETDPINSRFDWTIEPGSGMAIDVDREVTHAGGRSLRVRFDASANPTELGLRQETFLKPGRYRLRGYVRTAALSTDEGVALRVVSSGGKAPIDATTQKLRGTNDWTLVERVFDAPAGGGLVRVGLARKATLKFDNRLRGMVWIDQVSISEE